MPDDTFNIAVAKLEGRLLDLGITEWHDADAQRLAKRLHKFGNQLLTFLWFDDVPSDIRCLQ
jgi:transposase